MGSFSVWHWLVVLLVILLLFGGNKISGLMGDLAKGIKSFKANIKEDEKDATMAQPAASAPPAGNITGPQGATATAAEAQPAAQAAGAPPAGSPRPAA